MEAKSKKYQQEESVRQYFNQIAPQYRDRYSSARPFHQYFFEQRLQLATAGLDFQHKSVLDIGAGTGALYDYLKKSASNFTYYACDISGEMLSQSYISPACYHIGSIDTLDFSIQQFDFIFLLGLTSYLTQKQLLQHLDFIKSHLTPGGAVIISFTNRSALDFRFRKGVKSLLPKSLFKTRVINQRFEINAYTEQEVIQLCQPDFLIDQIQHFNYTNTILNTILPKASVAIANWLQNSNRQLTSKAFANDFLIRLTPSNPYPTSSEKPQNPKSKTAKFNSLAHQPASPFTLHPSPKSQSPNILNSQNANTPISTLESNSKQHSTFDIPYSIFNILMFSYYFPPIKSIGTLRNYNIYQEFVKYFHEVQVITTTNRHRLQQEVFKNTPSVHEAKTIDYRWWLSRKKDKHVHLAEGKKDKKWIRFLQRLLDSFPFNILVGDGGLFYIIAAYRKAKRLIQEKKIGYLYSSFRPYSDHIPPYLLKIWKPDLVWIADFRDLQVDVNVKNIFLENFQHWCNRRILAKADIITTVSEGLAQHLRRYHSKVYVLRNGIGAATLPKTKTKNFDKFTIAYTGSMFRKKRDPEPLLQVLAELIQEHVIDPEKIQIQYAGKDGILWNTWINKYQLGPIFNDLGMLPLEKANVLQHSAHINLLLTFSSPEMNGNLTGKLYEYLNAKRPILAIVNGSTEPELEAIISDLQIGQVVYHQQENTKKQIRAFVLQHYRERLKNGELTSAINENQLKNYYWESMMEKFLQSLPPSGIKNR